MKYRVVGVQYYSYVVEAEDHEAARDSLRVTMQYGSYSEIDQIKSGQLMVVEVIQLDYEE